MEITTFAKPASDVAARSAALLSAKRKEEGRIPA
jgi:hypothetical protein